MDKDEIKDVHSNKVGIPWLFNISWNNKNEIKEVHFNKVELFISSLLWILTISFLLCLGVLLLNVQDWAVYYLLWEVEDFLPLDSYIQTFLY